MTPSPGPSSVGPRSAASTVATTRGVVWDPLPMRDPSRVLRRVADRVPLRPYRVVVALLSPSRQYVQDAVQLPLNPGDHLAGPSASLRLAFAHAIDAMLGEKEHARRQPRPMVTMVCCRTGRVVRLPGDLAWYALLGEIAGPRELAVADAFVLTEHGWRTHLGHVNRGPTNPRPTLAA